MIEQFSIVMHELDGIGSDLVDKIEGIIDDTIAIHRYYLFNNTK